MSKRLLAGVAAVALVAAATGAQAAPMKHLPKKVRIQAQETVKVLDALAGQASAFVTLKVNGRRQPVRITAAIFQPTDGLGNSCGSPIPASVIGATAQFKSPHAGANSLRIVTAIRSVRKISGRYWSAKLTRSAYLGGIFYGCSHQSSPPAQTVCDYGTSQPGTIITPATDCGIPVTGAPYWITKPTLIGNTVYLPYLAVSSGYCWGTLPEQSGPLTWFGGETKYATGWACSDGTTLAPVVRVYLTAPNDPNGHPECQTSLNQQNGWPSYGGPWSFQVPAGLGGRLDVEWSFDVFRPDQPGNQPPESGEWASASFYFHGSSDGCAQLLAPVSPGS